MTTDESFLMSSIEPGFATLRVDTLHHAALGEWDQTRAEQVNRTSTPCRRQSGDGMGAATHPREPRLPQEVLRRALRYVNENLDAKLTWEQIASAVGMDHFKLGRGFKLSTGMTLHQYVIHCRIRQATKLLARAELAIADIALEVGCSCQSHLTTLFRKHTGTTPGAFRRAARRSPRLFDSAAASRGLSLGPLPEGSWAYPNGASRAHADSMNRHAPELASSKFVGSCNADPNNAILG